MALPTSAVRDQEIHINDNKQPYIIAASAICLPLAYIAVTVRFVIQRLARSPLGADDYTMLLALFITSIFVALVLNGMLYGKGRHWILVIKGAAFAKLTLILFCSNGIFLTSS